MNCATSRASRVFCLTTAPAIDGAAQSILIHVPQLRRTTLRTAALVVGALLCLMLMGVRADAATITVTSSAAADAPTPNACAGDPNDCTLAAAIEKANGDSVADVIEFDAAISTLTLNAALPAVTQPLTIDGAGIVDIDGSSGFAAACMAGSDYALDVTGAVVQVLGLAIHDVCGRAINSNVPAPTIRIGPRRADGKVALNGSAWDGTIEVFRSDLGGEGDSLFQSGITASGGAWSFGLDTDPSPGDSFTASITSGSTGTSNFSQPATVPGDLVSPELVRAVATADNVVRLDFNEYLGAGTVTAASFTLAMGGVNREITSVVVNGTSVYLGSATTPWRTGEAGAVTFTGNGRVADVSGNEVVGEPTATVFAGPGELVGPTITRFYTKWNKFCKKITSRCKRRKQTYLYVRLDKPARVVFNVYRSTKPRRFVVSYVRKLDAGTSKTRLYARMNGRQMPSRRWLVVQATAEDVARNFSLPVQTRFKIVTRNSQF